MANSELISSQLDRLFAAHHQTDRAFALWLYASILLGVLVLSFIALPYAERIAERRGLVRALDDVAQEIASTRQRLDDVAASMEGYRELRKKWEELYSVMTELDVLESLVEGTEEQARELEDTKERVVTRCLKGDVGPLKDWLKGQAVSSPNVILNYIEEKCPTTRDVLGSNVTGRPCWWLAGIAWQYCRLQGELTKRHGAINATYQAFPYRPDGADWAALQPAWAQAIAFFSDTTDLDERHPIDFTPVRQNLIPLSAAYSEFVGAVGNSLQTEQNRLSETLAARQKHKEALDGELAKVSADLDRINSFDKLQTPLGDVPITLNAVVLGLPLALCAAFVYTVSLFTRTMSLRREIARLIARQDPDRAITGPQQLGLLAPVWIEPWDAWPRQLVRYALLAGPLVLGASSALYFAALGIFAEGSGDFPGGAMGVATSYGVLFVVAVVALAHAVRVVRANAWRWDEGDISPGLPSSDGQG